LEGLIICAILIPKIEGTSIEDLLMAKNKETGISELNGGFL
jgi:hypothetical protein